MVLDNTNAMSIHNRKIILPLWFLFMTPSWAESDFGSDKIFQGQQLRDWETLYSANSMYTLQFYSPGGSQDRYLAIFQVLQVRNRWKPVWIANRNNPVSDSSGHLLINRTTGMLSIQHNRGYITLPTAMATGFGNINTSATLQDDGNLVLRQVFQNGSTSGTVLWQSFDYPLDVLLHGMKLGIDLKTGHEWSLASPSGSFTLAMDKNSTYGQLVILWHENVFWTSGQLHNGTFVNFQFNDSGLNFNFFSDENGKYFTYSPPEGSNLAQVLNYIFLTQDGRVILTQSNAEVVRCDLYSAFPRLGCVNYSSPACLNGDDEFEYSFATYSDFIDSTQETNSNLSIIDCEAKCKQNCSCYGYMSLDDDQTGCTFFTREAVEMMQNQTFGGATKYMYLRSTAVKGPGSNTTKNAAPTKRKQRWWIWLTIAAISGTSFLLLSIFFCIRRYCRVKAKRREAEKMMLHELVETTSDPPRSRTKAHEMSKDGNERMSQVHQFKFETIEMATDKFSLENKLGEGGFGPVYKGKLINGQDIAVKRLSRSSSQGVVEFKNEVRLIVKLQHKNLVRLLGCCIQREDMMLVYEYMPNKSLDFFLFDSSKRESLEWTNRMNIIEGIAQGLVYLHKHSRLTVIHRDLKASNILLDQNMAPKISDFGMARISGVQDCEVNTKRIVGTHGYMSPEYAINGVVSTKTDVFSFGVLVLEIVSGKKNHRSYHSERPLNLIGLAWELWIEERVVDLIDTTMRVSKHHYEIKRCINIGLLCVQDHAIDRPSMTDVILMLKNELLPLPTPKQPAFFIETSSADNDIEEGQEKICTNKLSTSIMEAR